MKIVDQVGDAAIQFRQLPAKRLEVFGVRVPAAISQGDTADTGLDQTAGGQELLDAVVAVADARLLAGQVKSPARGTGGDHVEGAGGKSVEAAHGAGGVDVAADGVESLKQTSAIVGPLHREAAVEAEIGQALTVRSERAIGDAEIAGLATDRLAAQADECRDVGLGVAPQARQHRAERGVVGGTIDLLAIAGHNLGVGVLANGNQGTHDTQLIEHACLLRHMLANLNAGDIGGDGLELAAVFGGSVRLHVVHVEMGRTAGQDDHDRGFVRPR